MLKRRDEIVKKFRVLTDEILNELSKKEIISSAIKKFYLAKEMEILLPKIAESRAMNKHDTPKAYEVAYTRNRLETYLDILVKVKDEIQSKLHVYGDFDSEIQEDIQNYINWGLRILNNQQGNYINYTESYFRIKLKFYA